MVVLRALLAGALAVLPGATPDPPGDALGLAAARAPGQVTAIGEVAAIGPTAGGIAPRTVPGPGGAVAVQLAPRYQAPTAVVVRAGTSTATRGPLALVAEVRRDPGPDTDGDNVAQRGLWESGGQVKLQLDGGVPSCVVAGSAGRVLVAAPGPVVPGVWYRLACTRVGDVVRLAVLRLDTGGRTGAQAVGPTGAVLLPAAVPLSVGGKVDPAGQLVVGPDPFAGAVARVELRSAQD